MRRATTWGLPALGLSTIGCGARALPAVGGGPGGRGRAPAGQRIRRGLAEMARHERAGDWSEARCKSTAALLLDGPPSAAASYDAGLVQRRCKRDGEAEGPSSRRRARANPRSTRRAPRSRWRGARAGSSTGPSPSSPRSCATRFNAPTPHRRSRAPDAPGERCRRRRGRRRSRTGEEEPAPGAGHRRRRHARDEPARSSAPRAGPPRVSGPPADRAPTRRRRPPPGALEMAALVCTQAIKKNPRWAPIHNTAGLIDVELGNLSHAAASFDEARRLDPRPPRGPDERGRPQPSGPRLRPGRGSVPRRARRSEPTTTTRGSAWRWPSAGRSTSRARPRGWPPPPRRWPRAKRIAPDSARGLLQPGHPGPGVRHAHGQPGEALASLARAGTSTSSSSSRPMARPPSPRPRNAPRTGSRTSTRWSRWRSSRNRRTERESTAEARSDNLIGCDFDCPGSCPPPPRWPSPPAPSTGPTWSGPGGR